MTCRNCLELYYTFIAVLDNKLQVNEIFAVSICCCRQRYLGNDLDLYCCLFVRPEYYGTLYFYLDLYDFNRKHAQAIALAYITVLLVLRIMCM